MELEHILAAADREGDAKEVFEFVHHLENRGDLDTTDHVRRVRHRRSCPAPLYSAARCRAERLRLR